jgi:hypothetical protein
MLASRRALAALPVWGISVAVVTPTVDAAPASSAVDDA